MNLDAKLLDYLRQHSKFIRGLRKKGIKLKYYSFEEFVLKNGQRFEISEEKPEYGQEKSCFMNSYHLMLSKDYTYVEGYALGVIPVLHAWCLDGQGKVVDPTWRPSLIQKFSGRSFYGVAFDRRFVIQTALRRKLYGVLENQEEDFPLLKGAEGWRVRKETALKT